MNRTYTVVLLKEPDGGYSVSVPALKGCHTQGDDLPEAFWMAEDAIRLYLESLEANGEKIPDDVDAFTMEMGDAGEASVYKVTVRGAAAVA